MCSYGSFQGSEIPNGLIAVTSFLPSSGVSPLYSYEGGDSVVSLVNILKVVIIICRIRMH